MLNDEICYYLKERFEVIGESYNLHLDEMNYDIDQVYILLRGEPRSNISKFVNAFRSSISRKVKELYPYVKSQLLESQFWSNSFCLITTGGAPTEAIESYIESQGEQNG